MEKLFHMIKLMNFVFNEYDGKLFSHDKANAETRKVHIISDERQRHIITKGNKKNPKITCSTCQKFTNILETLFQQTFSLYTNILLDQLKYFWFLIAFLLYLKILYSTLATKLVFKKIRKRIVIHCYKRESERKDNSN